MNNIERLPSPDPREERLLELLMGELVSSLDGDEARELDRLASEWDAAELTRLRESAARTVAECDIAAFDPDQASQLPLTARNRILAASPRGSSDKASLRSAPLPRWREGLAWLVAAAAVVAFLASRFVPARPPEVAVSPSTLRQSLIAKASASAEPVDAPVKLLNWTATTDAAAKGATGDVVWDNQSQKGFMRFKGLLPNDPTAYQYQLWIFDADQKHPIDGGVFDIGGDQEAIVPVHAKLRVSKPTLFAVTIEKPGGVVVSDKERIAVLAHWTPPDSP